MPFPLSFFSPRPRRHGMRIGRSPASLACAAASSATHSRHWGACSMADTPGLARIEQARRPESAAEQGQDDCQPSVAVRFHRDYVHGFQRGQFQRCPHGVTAKRLTAFPAVNAVQAKLHLRLFLPQDQPRCRRPPRAPQSPARLGPRLKPSLTPPGLSPTIGAIVSWYICVKDY